MLKRAFMTMFKKSIHTHLLPSRQRSNKPSKFSIWDAITAISTAASAVISIFVLYVGMCALKYTKQQVDDFRKESQAQHLIEKTKEFDAPQFKAIRKRLAKERLDKSHNSLRKLNAEDAPEEMYDELNFCNDLGLLTKNGALKPYDVWANFSYWIFPLYADSKDVIANEQKDYPASWANCTDLLQRIKNIEKQEDNGKQGTQTADEIIDFYKSEL